MKTENLFPLGVLLVLSALSTTAWAGEPEGVEIDADPAEPSVYQGNPVGTCGWPTAVAVTSGGGLCTGTLVHPRVVVYAAHCGAELVSRPEGLGFSESYDGGKTLYWYLTDEDMLELGKDVDTWIYPGSTFEDVYRNKKEMLDQFKSVQNKNVYDTQGQGPNSWHEQRLAEYDIVALDVCTLVGTNNPDTIHRRRWIRNYFNEQMEGLGGCNTDEIDLAYIPAQAQCTPVGGEAPSGQQETPQSPATAVGLELAAAVFAGAMAALMG